jgi:hypothetical protein
MLYNISKYDEITISVSNLLISDSIKASIIVAILYLIITVFILAAFNYFWCFGFNKNLNTINIERKNRAEKQIQLQKLIKLGETASKKGYIERMPKTKAVNIVLTSEQKAQIWFKIMNLIFILS